HHDTICVVCTDLAGEPGLHAHADREPPGRRYHPAGPGADCGWCFLDQEDPQYQSLGRATMDYLIGVLNNLFHDPQMVQMTFIALRAVAVFCLALAGMFLMSTLFHPVRNRLHTVVAPEAGDSPKEGPFAPAVKALSPYLMPKKDKERSRTRARLVHAGYRGENALANFYAI